MAHSSTARAWAQGGTVFGATMMIVIGVYQVLMGLVAVVRNEFYVVTPNYLYEIDTTAWGWIHLGIGALCILVGAFVFTGAAWARWLGIAIVSLSAIANFFFVPYYPLWSLLIIAADAWVIWSLATSSLPGRHVMEPGAAATAGPGAGYPESERWPRINVPGTGEQPERDMQPRSSGTRATTGIPREESPAQGGPVRESSTQRPMRGESPPQR